jgi:hypothetical protein
MALGDCKSEIGMRIRATSDETFPFEVVTDDANTYNLGLFHTLDEALAFVRALRDAGAL